MRSIEQLKQALDKISGGESALYTLSDLRSILPESSAASFRTLLSRAQKNNILERVCRGLYIYPNRYQSKGLLLFHAAARLRAHEFNYISLETALSDAGVISQIPLLWITLMSSGRTQKMDCGRHGTIEFIHTVREASAFAGKLKYDKSCHLWRADISLAVNDMKHTRRDLELIDRVRLDESV